LGDFKKLGDTPKPPAGGILHLFIGPYIPLPKNDKGFRNPETPPSAYGGLHLKGHPLYAVAYEGPGFDLKGSAPGA